MAVCSWGWGAEGQYCRSHVECMGRAVMPSDVEPEDLFARREWARAVGGVGPGG